MPLYRILCISAHFREFTHIKELVTQSATLLLENGGVVRDIESMGMRTLPQRMFRHKAWHSYGDYWAISFDASPQLMAQLARRLRADPRVIRWTTRKLGERLDDISPAARTVGGALGGQTVRLYGRSIRFDADDVERSHLGRNSDNNNTTTSTSTTSAFDAFDAFDDDDDLCAVPMAPQQRSAYQDARRRTGGGQANFYSTAASATRIPLARSQARLETRWLDEQHHM